MSVNLLKLTHTHGNHEGHCLTLCLICELLWAKGFLQSGGGWYLLSIYSCRQLWPLLHREPTVCTQKLQRYFRSIFLYFPNLSIVCFCFQGPSSTFLLQCSTLQGFWRWSRVLTTIILSLVIFPLACISRQKRKSYRHYHIQPGLAYIFPPHQQKALNDFVLIFLYFSHIKVFERCKQEVVSFWVFSYWDSRVNMCETGGSRVWHAC